MGRPAAPNSSGVGQSSERGAAGGASRVRVFRAGELSIDLVCRGFGLSPGEGELSVPADMTDVGCNDFILINSF